MITYRTLRIGPLRFAKRRGEPWYYASHGARWLQHGGWFFFSVLNPIMTLRWWWRFMMGQR